MYITFFIALLSTFLYINTVLSEYMSFICNKSQTLDKESLEISEKRIKFRTVLTIIMALFWSASILYII